MQRLTQPRIRSSLQLRYPRAQYEERPYKTTWVWNALTSKEYASNECSSLTGWCEPAWDIDVDQLLANTKTQITAACFDELQRIATEKGYNVAVTKIEPYAIWEKRYTSRQYRDYTMVRAYGRLKCGAAVEFESDVEFSLSGPEFSPLVWWAMLFAMFLGFLLALYVAARLLDLLESMFIKETTTTTSIHHPDCTTETTTTTTREPDWMAILIMGLVGLGVIVTLAVVVPALRGK